MARSGLELDLTARGSAAPRACVDPPALSELGSPLIAAAAGLASAADAVVVVKNSHDQDATASIGLLQLKSPAKSVRLVICPLLPKKPALPLRQRTPLRYRTAFTCLHHSPSPGSGSATRARWLIPRVASGELDDMRRQA
jgi:hypothetical protein